MQDNNLGLPFWEGFLASDLERKNGATWITLVPDPRAPLVCSGCDSNCWQIHETGWRVVRDMPMLGDPVWLRVRLRRVRCSECGTRAERVKWLDRHARVTQRLAEFVGLWCQKLPVAHVCKLSGLHWDTVRRIERTNLAAQIAALPDAQPTRLVMDEFALYKGHRYATVVLDADTRRVLWVGEGRSREALRPFFEWLGPERCRAIEAVAMDMNTAFDLEVKEHCPQAHVVYDLFHVVAKYGREVIDRVRVDEANRLKHDLPMRKVVKRARWLLLRNRANIPAEKLASLDELLAANQTLSTVYIMKAALKELWSAQGAWQWRTAWQTWLRMANESGVEPLQKFARKLKPYWRGIVARVRWPMHTGQLEGINNRIKVMKRMAYGYRDSEFFFLKIKAAFPGNP
ncbi:ISL3 family transposase [Pseudoduganella chitinolytica]|uniref:ISL3 family transposase n=1 Tax=Pseudoduganella chitinolytica TaxID=34070 RepID=A0ABY8BCH4_9BURK|nr:ISL3 family transposase [Pseudoduganella chitinolytica]WEF32663.1 ISL3 family transposase [Pseudoduganella chitinolytica]WEF33615.1 ISL3 family transposase [Pseudoduganella chitinolytica]WEF35140.1 ISL3 family transposase [Pseudoduganella chitinolytica]WEF35476.1 ISL3 family transposase [Pseudoduganella chitinolytica]